MYNMLNFWDMSFGFLSRLLLAQSLTLAHLQVFPRFNLATSTVPDPCHRTAKHKVLIGFTWIYQVPGFRAHVLLIKIELSLSHFQLVLFRFIPMPHFLRCARGLKKVEAYGGREKRNTQANACCSSPPLPLARVSA